MLCIDFLLSFSLFKILEELILIKNHNSKCKQSLPGMPVVAARYSLQNHNEGIHFLRNYFDLNIDKYSRIMADISDNILHLR